MYVNSRYMKQQDRGNTQSNGKEGGSYIGWLTESKATQWKPISSHTIGELAAGGKLSLAKIDRMVKLDTFNLTKFRDAFWRSVDIARPTREQLEAINRFSYLLF